jgi:short-subunit dehydrogenase
VTRLRDYRGLTALVTGASSGIGRLLSLRLAERGAKVGLLARRADRLDELASTIRERGGEALALPCDVAEADQVIASCERARESLGPVDLLVNNAGYGRHRQFLEWDPGDVERMMRVNYLGAVHATRALLPGMVERGHGWVVFVSSVVGKIAVADESAYVATKFAMTGLAESISLEVEDAGVHVLTVYPGAIRTPFFDEEALGRMPPVALRSMIEPEPLVEAILKALARGRRELVYPRRLGVIPIVRALAPGFLRRQIRRHTVRGRRPR